MLLPIVERELRVAARQAASYRLRFWTVAATIGVGGLIVITSSKGTQPHALAQTLFIACGVLALSVCMVAGLFLTADCLSVEKREQTLGLLFLTDLRGYDVVLGKLATTSLQAVYALLGLFPVMAVPLLMGGVTGAEVGRLVLVLLATMFFSLATGMLVSALSRETRQATLATLGFLIFTGGILPLLWWTGIIFLKVKIVNGLLYPSPVFTFIAGLEESYRKPGGAGEFLGSLLVVSSLGLVFLTWACFLSARIWREKKSGESESRVNNFASQWRYGNLHWRKKLRAGLDANPIFWLASRDQLTSGLALVVMGLLLMVWVLFFIGLGFDSVTRSQREEALLILIIVSFGLHLVFKCLVALEASRRLSEDYQSGALELLACTPITNQEFVRGFDRALARQFRMPMLWLGMANIALALLIRIHDPGGMGRDRFVFFWIFLGGVVLLFSDFYTLVWVSLRMALRGRRHHLVVLGALTRVMLPPWAAIFLFFVIIQHSGFSEETAKKLVFCWFLGCASLDLIQGMAAGKQLKRGFRKLLAEAETKSAPTLSSSPKAEFSAESGLKPDLSLRP